MLGSNPIWGSGAEVREGRSSGEVKLRPGGRGGVARRRTSQHEIYSRQWDQHTCGGQKWKERDQAGWGVTSEGKNGFR